MIVLLGVPWLANAADWSTCASDLDDVRRAARDASDIANEVESAKSALENCRNYREGYDYRYDQCRSKLSSYNSEIDRLNSELDTLNRRIRSASSSCTDSSPRVGGSRRPTNKCETYRQYLDRLPLESIIRVCTSSMTEAECRACLAR